MGVPPRLRALAGMFVLVVDDNVDAREILRSTLTYLGAIVATAASATAALNILGQIQPGVVVCDVNLGAHDAFWLVRQVRTLLAAAPPFIAISAQDYDEDELQSAGFVAFLRKPIQHEVLVTEILRAAML
jgi:CheY-like chemotaxis protein